MKSWKAKASTDNTAPNTPPTNRDCHTLTPSTTPTTPVLYTRTYLLWRGNVTRDALQNQWVLCTVAQLELTHLDGAFTWPVLAGLVNGWNGLQGGLWRQLAVSHQPLNRHHLRMDRVDTMYHSHIRLWDFTCNHTFACIADVHTRLSTSVLSLTPYWNTPARETQ